MKYIFISISLILMTACSSQNRHIKLICPSIQQYSSESQKKLAEELIKLPNDSIIFQYMGDYAKLRTKLRVCYKNTVDP